mmetsp:Transcript_37474/g.101569  ORF Transcript_37474/g.101569 Transcript_37474/m.101569 type:complete len:160 (-) Transcript_37474:546-1025(-)
MEALTSDSVPDKRDYDHIAYQSKIKGYTGAGGGPSTSIDAQGLGLGLRLGLAVSGGGEDPPNVPTHAIGTGTGTTGPIGPNRSNSNADTTGDASDGGLGSTGVAAGSEGTADDVRAYDGTNLASSMSTESRFVAMGLAPLVASPLAMGPTPLVSESVNQ